MTTPNTALNVLGADHIQRRINAVARGQRIGGVLQEAIRALMRRVYGTIPVVSGKLSRNTTVKVGNGIITITFNTTYARFPNERSKRNSRFVQRGIAAGIIAANRIRRRAADGTLIQFRFSWNGRIQYFGGRHNPKMRVEIAYR